MPQTKKWSILDRCVLCVLCRRFAPARTTFGGPTVSRSRELLSDLDVIQVSTVSIRRRNNKSIGHEYLSINEINLQLVYGPGVVAIRDVNYSTRNVNPEGTCNLSNKAGAVGLKN